MTDKSERNWLIRTRSMQILGPVSLAKVLELIEKGSLRDEDEVTSGNGYWFCVRETELVERYLTNGIAQGFNPISEAKTVLSNGSQEVAVPSQTPVAKESQPVLTSEEEIAPVAEEDLEYPDIGDMAAPIVNPEPSEDIPDIVIAEEDLEERDDVTMVATNIELPSKPVETPTAPKVEVPEIEPEIEQVEDVEEEEKVEVVAEPVKKVVKKTKVAAKTLTPRKSDRYLFLLLALVISLVIGVIYYYRTILNKPLPGFETSWLIDSAHAQSAILTSNSKKKVQIAFLQS